MLSGKWTVVTSMGTVNLLLNLKVSDSTLTGSIWYRNKSVKIIGGKIRDQSFSFQALVTTKHGIIPVFVQGYFIDATHIAGIVKCKLGSLRFTAVKIKRSLQDEYLNHFGGYTYLLKHEY